MNKKRQAIWSILAMLTIWCIVNSSNINSIECSQEEMDAVTEKLLKQAVEKESLSNDEFEDTYKAQRIALEEALNETESETFEDVFARMRNQYGKGHVFIWNGKEYTTDYLEEVDISFYGYDSVSGWVLNTGDRDDYCATNDRDECGVCGGDGSLTWYADRDGDGLGDINTVKQSCEEPERLATTR